MVNKDPSGWGQRILICFIAGIAFFIAVYMGLYQWRLIPDVWDPVFHEETKKVLDSEVSHEISQWILVPDSLFGALAYLGDIFFSLAGSTKRWMDRPWLVILFGIDVIPVGATSVILIVLQGTVVGAYCFLCWITAAISLILIFLAYGEVYYSLLFLHRVRKRDKRLFWKTFWGQSSPEAWEIACEMSQTYSKKEKS